MHLNKDKFNLNFILLNSSDSDLERFLIQNHISTHRLNYKGKKDILSSVFTIYKILKKQKASIVHTHLFDANIVGLIAAKLARIPKRIHTRHHSNYHHIYYPNAIKYDKMVNRLSTDIIAISNVVKDILIKDEQVNPTKIHLIYHGFELEQFAKPDLKKVAALRAKYNPTLKTPVIGVISRFIELKGVQYIVPAYKEILKIYPNALLLFFNAKGDYERPIDNLLNEIPPTSFAKIKFEPDIVSLYKIFDLFIHVPIEENIEAFGQTYVECLAAGVPLIASKSGIGKEILEHKQNSMVVPFKDSVAIKNSILMLLEDEALRKKIVSHSYSTVSPKFDISVMIRKLENLYLL